MDQLESISQWIAQNQQTTLILGVACIFGALIFLFWAARELMSWFLRTGQILDQVENLRDDVRQLTSQLAVQLHAQTERTNLDVVIKAATDGKSSASSTPIAAITSVPAAQLSQLIEQNSSGGQMTSNGPKFRLPANDKLKSSFPIRHS